MTHICVSKLTIIGSDNGLSPGRRQAIIWTNTGILLIGPFRIKLQWNFNRNWNIFIQENAFENIVCEMTSICLGLNVLRCVSDGYPRRQIVWFIPEKVVLKTHIGHWGRVTHICVSELTIIGSDDDLSPGRRQAIIWTNAGILLIGALRTNFSEALIEILTFSFKKVHLKKSLRKTRSLR